MYNKKRHISCKLIKQSINAFLAINTFLAIKSYFVASCYTTSAKYVIISLPQQSKPKNLLFEVCIKREIPI